MTHTYPTREARIRWNQMTSEDRYDLLCTIWPAGNVVSKFALQKWAQLNSRMQAAITRLLIPSPCRKCGTNGDHYCPADVATE